MSNSEWSEVNRQKPCPICQKPDWCGISADGAVRCMRVGDAPGWRVVKNCPDGGIVYRPENDNGRSNGQMMPPVAPAKKPASTYPSLDDLAESVSGWSKHRGGSLTIHEYHDGYGETIFAVLRYDFSDGRCKQCLPVHLSIEGWRIGDSSYPLPLYHLDKLGDDTEATTFVCEGEKAVDALCRLGLRGTTSSHGSKAANKTDWVPLAGQNVVILPDNDAPGLAYANQVAQIVTSLDPPAKVRIVNLKDYEPCMPDGDDIVEYIEFQGDDRPIAIRKKLLQFVDKTPEWRPETVENDHIERPAWRPFPVEVLPQPLRVFVTEAASALGCDEAFIALPALSMLASLVGTTRVIRLKDTWTEPCVLWTCIVAESGSLKSAALALALEPVHTLQADAMDVYEDQLEAYQSELARYQIDLRRVKKGSDCPEKPKPPSARRYTVSDITLEALGTIIHQNQRGVLLARDELAAWFQSFDRYRSGKGGDAAGWNELHRSGTLVVDRKTSDRKTLYVRNAITSLTGTIQPAILYQTLTREFHESGLAARLLLASPPRRPKRWNNNKLPDQTRSLYCNLAQKLCKLTHDRDVENRPIPKQIGFTPDGYKAWKRFYDQFAVLQNAASGDRAAVLSKLEGACARFALLFHLIREADGDINVGDGIGAEDVVAGSILTEWFAHEIGRVYGMFGCSESEREDSKLIEFIEQNGRQVTPRKVQRGLSRIKTADEAKAALDRLVKAGKGEWYYPKPNETGGRPSSIFRLTTPLPNDNTPISGTAGGFVHVDGVSDAKNEFRGGTE